MTKFDPDGDIPFLLDKILNQGIEFDDNVRGAFIEFETIEGIQEIVHNLGTTPVGFITIYREGAIVLWAEKPESWNGQSLFLRSNVPNETVRIFVM